MSASKACINRLQKEYRAILKVRCFHDRPAYAFLDTLFPETPSPYSYSSYNQAQTRSRARILSLRRSVSLQEPVPNIKAHPSPSNILEWHYALEGSPNTEYEGGVYHG